MTISPFRSVVALSSLALLLGAGAVGAPHAHAEPDIVCFGLIPTILGTAAGETIVGTPGNDVIHGHDGNDTIDGKGGNDTICGGYGSDTVLGGSGNDQLAGNDLDTFGPHVDTVSYAGAGAAVTVDLVAGTGTGQGTDTLVGFLNIVGGNGNDSLRGTRSNNTIAGGPGNDTVDGIAASDTISFKGAPNVIDCSLETGVATGQGTDTIRNIDHIIGGNNHDVLTGNAGANTILGGPGDDDIDGLAGGDTASYSTAPNAVNANLTTKVATGHGTDALDRMENLIGSVHGDTLVGSAAKNTITGALGDDLIDGKGNLDTLNFAGSLAGVGVAINYPAFNANGNGFDTGTSMENVIASTFGDDITFFNGAVAPPTVIRGNAGNDEIITGNADDWVDPGPGDDTVTTLGGNDTIVNSLGSDALNAGTEPGDLFDASGTNAHATVNLTTGSASGADIGVDSLAGFEYVATGNGDDTVTGNASNNWILPGFGNDTVNGTFGIDTVSYANLTSAPAITINLGTNSASGAGTDGLAAIENATGGPGNDTLIGGITINVLDGGPGTDTCTSGAGDTELNCEI